MMKQMHDHGICYLALLQKKLLHLQFTLICIIPTSSYVSLSVFSFSTLSYLILLNLLPSIHPFFPSFRLANHASIHLSKHPSKHRCLHSSTRPFIHPSVHPCAPLSYSPSHNLSYPPSIRPSVQPSIHPFSRHIIRPTIRSFVHLFFPSFIHPSIHAARSVGRSVGGSVLRSSSLAFGAVTKTQLTQSSIRAPRANLSRCVPLPLSHRPTSPLRPSAPDRVT